MSQWSVYEVLGHIRQAGMALEERTPFTAPETRRPPIGSLAGPLLRHPAEGRTVPGASKACSAHAFNRTGETFGAMGCGCDTTLTTTLTPAFPIPGSAHDCVH